MIAMDVASMREVLAILRQIARELEALQGADPSVSRLCTAVSELCARMAVDIHVAESAPEGYLR